MYISNNRAKSQNIMKMIVERNLPSKIDIFWFVLSTDPLQNSKHLHENFAKLFDDTLSLAMRRDMKRREEI